MSDRYAPPPASPDEKKVVTGHDGDLEGVAPSGRDRWFGGPNVTVGPRIGPVLSSLSSSYGNNSDSDDSSSAILHKQKEAEANATIQYRTCSWQKVCVPRARCLVSPPPPPNPHDSTAPRRVAHSLWFDLGWVGC